MKKIITTFLITTIFWMNMFSFTHISLKRYYWDNIPPATVCDSIFSFYKDAVGPNWAVIIKEIYKIVTFPVRAILKEPTNWGEDYRYFVFHPKISFWE